MSVLQIVTFKGLKKGRDHQLQVSNLVRSDSLSYRDVCEGELTVPPSKASLVVDVPVLTFAKLYI